jgi:DNA-binding transcriptional regulator YdaS (Cro superfamily)
MKPTELKKLKEKADKIGRKVVADKIGMSYNLLSQKFNGFLAISAIERLRIEAVIENLSK